MLSVHGDEEACMLWVLRMVLQLRSVTHACPFLESTANAYF